MVPQAKLTMVDVAGSWESVLRQAAASPFSRLPAYRGSRDNIVGIVRVKDVVHRHISEGPPASADSLLRPFVKVPHTLAGDQVIALLRGKRAHLGGVVDDTGAIVGFITIQDVLGAFLGAEAKML
jgi:CBS domain containing-hemolysin-like protein